MEDGLHTWGINIVVWMTIKSSSINWVRIRLEQLDFCLHWCKWEFPNSILPAAFCLWIVFHYLYQLYRLQLTVFQYLYFIQISLIQLVKKLDESESILCKFLKYLWLAILKILLYFLINLLFTKQNWSLSWHIWQHHL